ncbi:hypothetical protein LPB87_16825 [Flavobacterium sp. EDS]|uniref:hypothetical protein n=1 Tax=Flavobacterium sp. EDS TaxID=2897328 RepID=UPI001E3D79FC|nr:hypothetical protein [Flavobacterium sp. EDS]MCD0476064.1 hypothetical protein [Flavobacterium sp. EDS]
MNQNIINLYKIEFINKISQYDQKITKISNLKNDTFSAFLFDWNADEINKLLLPDIEEALSSATSEIENGSETISIILYQDKVHFYDDNGFTYQITTKDFKEIVIGWRDFLLTPPLNGNKV